MYLHIKRQIHVHTYATHQSAITLGPVTAEVCNADRLAVQRFAVKPFIQAFQHRRSPTAVDVASNFHRSKSDWASRGRTWKIMIRVGDRSQSICHQSSGKRPRVHVTKSQFQNFSRHINTSHVPLACPEQSLWRPSMHCSCWGTYCHRPPRCH